MPAGTTLFGLRAAHKPSADVLVYNGAVANADVALQSGDAVVLIQRGEAPSADELEALMAARHTPGECKTQGVVLARRKSSHCCSAMPARRSSHPS